ncbi:hypothetical protein C1637_11050 [Chryseobacterium lactis]|uniref:Uncharacterized protein n=1 Tax=Chryseobacterium lactis TaxID=1241981 RepID=A0A3G6RLT7_CHRLC|nr:hypothetical protein [Chryseobacterium lactis]AZA80920.1 hypothetical protein EG342_02890 [Chryseobacterium lactis]AZB05921.1 hypothetical protein EG341_19015 [Chryseobacterium lactis]PNW13359.1 hypothetical protein C1637_11050 [Chryseobacterium lactis]
MKIIITAVLLLVLINCKKENSTTLKNISNDSISTPSTVKNNTLKSDQPKEEIFKFVTELCDNTGYFDSNKYSREEIEGAYKLKYDLHGTLLDTPSVFGLNDLQEVRRDKDKILSKLDKDFAEKKALLQNLKIVNSPYWQNIKKLKYEALLQQYELEKIRIAAYSDPSILLSTNKCQNFAKALNSTDEQMVSEWRKLREQMSKKNADPERIMTQFNEHLNSSDKRDFAIIDLITFGWGNCVNGTIQRPSYDEKMTKEFDSLFIKVDSDCDEP